MTESGPHIDEIRSLRDRLSDVTLRTPVMRCAAIEASLGDGTRVLAKLEFLQRTGTFKARGALATLHSLSADERKFGVTAVSAGNHAIATAFAAQTLGTTAKVVMTRSANPFRVAVCKSYGAEVVIADDVHQAFELVREIRDTENRFFVHPFEGYSVALGTGTVGLEICEQVDDVDAIVIPVGGGGLIGGISNAVKQLRPDVEVIGVEPKGADSMHRSFKSGKPESISEVHTIADSLGAPFALPYSFELTRNNVDRLVMVDDSELRKTMGFLFHAMSIAVEPACAATTAALLGPLRESLSGKRVLLVMCGSNIDWETFARQADFSHVA
ncbi:MAG: pyridoxal-phosphate dependent enzyme [Gammaproteobacteria bacterium]|jgi:threonine dehydratase|nr:pyridoxal-phosphate dependent enzyme [Gammaproteobacteria bacterium]